MKSKAKEGLVLGGQGGGAQAFEVGQSEAGRDKGETWLPPGGLVEQNSPHLVKPWHPNSVLL